MTINSITLRNFKCFRDLQINFSKLTLLTGENSSGKSSLIYGLLMVFQSKEFPFYLSPNGKYVDMGDFIEISLNHTKNHIVGLDITLSDKNNVPFVFSTDWTINLANKMPRLHHLHATSNFHEIDLRRSSSKDSYVLDFNYEKKKYLRSPDFEAMKAIRSFMQAVGTDEANRTAEEQRFYKSMTEVKNIKGLKIDKLDNLQKALVKANHGGEQLAIQKLSRAVENNEEYLNFVSSFRTRPERTYYQKSRPTKVEGSGENYIDQVLEWEYSGAKEFSELNSILVDLKLASSLKTQKISGGRYDLRVKVRNGSPWASLPDVGFGISQLLPIIVADLQLPQGSTLIVAQPEIHLHPSVQARLADYFVKQIRDTNKRYIIETHSEYLLNRIRLAITKENIKTDDVSTYYFENTRDGSIKYQIDFTKDGQIKNAPTGFFDTYMMDVLDIALNA